MSETTFKLSGLNCEACQKVVTMCLSEIQGVAGVNVSLKTGEVKVSADREVSREEVVRALDGTHYKVI